MALSSVQIPGYEILRPLGTGGMSTVYLALQRSLDRKVAIKVMRRGSSESDADTQGEKPAEPAASAAPGTPTSTTPSP